MKRMVAILALLALGQGAASARPAGLWLQLTPERSADWLVEGNPATSERVTISTRDTAPGRFYRVYVLTSGFSPSYVIGINEILRVFHARGVAARLDDMNLDAKKERGERAIAEIRQGHYDLVMTIGSEATAFLYRRYKGGTVPVVTAESKDPVLLGQMRDYTSGSGTNFAFTSLNVPIALQMEYIKRLVPGLANIGVLYSTENTSAVQTQVEPLVAAGPRYGVSVLRVAATSSDYGADFSREMPKAIAAMRRRDPDLRHSVFWIVGSTRTFSQIHTIDQHAGHVPVLSAVPEVVAPGDDSAMLAIGASFENNGALAGLYGASILAGHARVGDLKVGIVTPPDIAINFRKAREDRLAIPFDFFETATRVVDGQGRLVRANGHRVVASRNGTPAP